MEEKSLRSALFAHPQGKKTVIWELAHKPIRRDNEYGTSYDDAFRRDFSVNAVFYDPSTNKLIDYTKHGIRDLKQGIIRVIGNPYIRFSEDPVRMLRALKLVGQYNLTITAKAEEALYASLEQITLCSKSRLTLELEKILRKPYSEKIFQVFKQYGFLQYFLPNIDKNWDTESSQTALQLLSCHCERLQKEKSSNYLSTVLALLAIPFVNKHLTDDATNCLWDYFPGIEKETKSIVHHVFHPYTFPKYIISATTDAIMLQQKFYTRKQAKKTRQHPHFRIAREVATDLNKILWQKPELTYYWQSKRRREC